jgi:hypothetical protein
MAVAEAVAVAGSSDAWVWPGSRSASCPGAPDRPLCRAD